MTKNVLQNKRTTNRYCANFFPFTRTICKIKKRLSVFILILENTIESISKSSCSKFQLYFYKNLFDPDEKSKILNHENLNKKTLETKINRIFSTDVVENEHIIKNFREEYDL